MKIETKNYLSHVFDTALLIAVSVFILVVPFSKEGSKLAQYTAIVLWVLALSFKRKKNISMRSWANIPVLAFMIAAIISTVFSLKPYHSQQILFQRYAIYGLFYFIGYTFLNGHSKSINWLVGSMLLLGLIIGAGGFTDFIISRPYRLQSVFGKGIYMSAFLPFVLPFSFFIFVFERNRWFRLGGFINTLLLVPVFVWHGSRGIWIAISLALVISMVLFFSSKTYRLSLLMSIFLVCASLYAAPAYIGPRIVSLQPSMIKTAMSDRVNLSDTAISIFRSRPIHGAGLGMFEFLYAPPVGHENDKIFNHSHAHNNFLEIAAEMGLIGLIPFCAMFVVLFAALSRSIRNCSDKVRALNSGLAMAIIAMMIACFSGSFITVGVQAAVLFFFLFGVSINLATQACYGNNAVSKEGLLNG